MENNSELDNKISIIGCGKLGLSFALLCDDQGYAVHCYDVDNERMEQIKNRTLKTTEPTIEEFIEIHELKLVGSIKEAVEASDLIFLFVATPSKESGEYDHTQIEAVIEQIELLDAEMSLFGKTIVISCTVMPKYCAQLQQRVKPLGINIVYNPEFIAQGNVIWGLENADMVLIGGENIPEKLFQLYRDIMVVEPIFNVLSLTGAEIAKISINTFLTLKTAYANLIGEICINSGEEQNTKQILEAIGSDTRIGNKYLGYGLPASGVCLPRDLRALREYMLSIGIEKYFISALMNENDRHLQYLKDYFIQNNPDKNVPFIFNQLSYKKGVPILTESGHYKLCKELLNSGYKVIINESPIVIDAAIPELSKYDGQVKYEKSGSKFSERRLEGQKKQGYVIEL